MFGLGTSELLVILVIIFLLFGAKKLPGIAKALGKAVKEFRNPTEESEEKDKEMSKEKDNKK